MFANILTGLGGLTEGVQLLFTLGGLKNIVMLLIAGVLIYLGVKKDVEPLLLVPIGFGCLLVNIPLSDLMHPGHRLRRQAGVRRHRHARRRQGADQGRHRLPAHHLQHGHRQRAVPAAHLHRHRRDDGFRAAAGEPEDPAVRRRRPVRHLPHSAARARARLPAPAGGEHRHHRGVRRSDRDLRRLAIRARAARADLGRRLFLHGAGADHPAADHAGADDRQGTQDAHAEGQAQRSRRT